MEVLQNRTRWDDWIILADSDELHEFPGPVVEYLRGLEAEGMNLVYGRMKVRRETYFWLWFWGRRAKGFL